MKFSCLIIFLLILALPVAYADINIDSFSSNNYNYGSKVLISGSIVRPSDVRARLELNLVCSTGSSKILSLIINLKSNELLRFSQLVTIPNSVLGSCKLKSDLLDYAGNLLETKEVYAFDVTNDVKGLFQSEGTGDYQLGDIFSLKGTFSRMDDTLVDGSVLIKFRQLENIVFIDSSEALDGMLDYSKTLSLLPAGHYSVDVVVTDNFGNTHGFIDSTVFNLENEINVNVGLDKTSYKPADVLVLTGSASGSKSNDLHDIDVEIIFENEKIKRSLQSSKEGFSYNYRIPANIKSGKHTVNIKVQDIEGNYGEKLVNFNVNAVPTSLSLSLDSSEVIPGAGVSFFTNLLDQANDPISESVALSVKNNKDETIFSKILKASSRDSFSVPEGSLPGDWKVRVDGFGLSNEIPLKIKEHKKIDVNLENNLLVVNNTGNVPFNGFLEIVSGSKKTGKDIKLKIGKTATIQLNKLVDEGIHNIEVPFAGKKFNNVDVKKDKGLFSRITGNVAANTASGNRPYMLYSALVVIILSLIYIFMKKTSFKRNNTNRFNIEEFELGQKKLKELKARGIRKDRPVEYGKATQEDIEDYKKRIVNQFSEEKNSSSNNYSNTQRTVQDDKPRGGLFNMFN